MAERPNHALGPLRQALRLARDSGSGERMGNAVALAAHVLHRRGRAREVATLVGAVEAVTLRLPRKQDQLLVRLPLITQVVSGTHSTPPDSLVSAGFDEHRVAGRSLSLERAADLALRVLDEELALAVKLESGGEAAAEAAPALAVTHSDGVGVFRREADVWAVTWAGRTVRARPMPRDPR